MPPVKWSFAPRRESARCRVFFFFSLHALSVSCQDTFQAAPLFKFLFHEMALFSRSSLVTFTWKYRVKERDGSSVKSTRCSCGGLEFCSQHLPWAACNAHSSSCSRPNALFHTLGHLHSHYSHPLKDKIINTHMYIWIYMYVNTDIDI